MNEKNIQLSFTKTEIVIAKYLFRHYGGKHNARQIARLLKLNHANVNKLCTLLVSKRLLEKEDLGNATYYSYGKDKHATNFMTYILSLEQLPEWLLTLQHKLEEFEDIKIGAVFGSSIASKNFNDVDVLLVYEPEQASKIRTIKDKIRKSQLIQKPIRYVDMTIEDILKNKEDPVIYNILSNNILFKGPEEYVKLIIKCRK